MSQLVRAGKVNMSVCKHRTFLAPSGSRLVGLVLNLTLGGASVTLHSHTEIKSKRKDKNRMLNESKKPVSVLAVIC